MRRIVTALFFALFLAPGGWGGQWEFADGRPAGKVAHDPRYSFPGGFKAEVVFAIDLQTIDARSGFANLFCKGNDFNLGYSVMVSRDGRLLVDLKGVEPSYYMTKEKIVSGRETTLEIYVTPASVRIFIDGTERGSYPFSGSFDFSNDHPLHIGTMGGYRFTGTMKSLRLLPISEVVLPPGGPKPLATSTPKRQKRAEILWTKPLCVQKDRYIGWPTVCRLRNGEIIAVFSGDRDEHVCPWGKVQLVRSCDGGESWSRPQTIVNGPIDDRDAGVVQMPDGEIVVTYFTSEAYRERLYDRDFPRTDPRYWWRRHDEKISADVRRAALGYFRISSRDNGKTWSKPEKMAKVSHAPHGPSLMKDGTLLQLGRSAVRRTVGGKIASYSLISAWKSRDAARTWECLCPEVPDSDGENSQPFVFHEPNAIELPDGTILGLVRYHGEDGCLRQTVSEDGGRTWSAMVKTGLCGYPAHLISLCDGKLVAVYGRRQADPGYGEFAAISDDGGKTWDVENEIMLRHCHNDDLGYPSSCVLADGCILTVYYQSERVGRKPCLMATKWRVLQ